jgi:hypothetical protein
MIRTVAEKKK